MHRKGLSVSLAPGEGGVGWGVWANKNDMIGTLKVSRDGRGRREERNGEKREKKENRGEKSSYYSPPSPLLFSLPLPYYSPPPPYSSPSPTPPPRYLDS